MEPMLAGLAGRLAGGVVQKSFKSLTGGAATNEPSKVPSTFPEWDEEVDHRGGLILKDPASGETATILTQDQVAQIVEFMESPECVALTQFLLIGKFGSRVEGAFSAVTEGFEDAFCSLVDIHCSERNYNWSDLADVLWALLTESLEQVFPLDQLSSFVTADEQKRLSSYVGTTSLIEGRMQPANVAFRELADIAGDRRRFEAARHSLYDIRTASAGYYSEVNLAHTLGHTQESFRFDSGVLYVTRSLRRHNSSELHTDEFLARPLSRPRCVVIGNPGVGKSTMVQHLIHKVSSSTSADGSDFAPLLIQCREFAAADSSKYILDAITRSLRENLQLEIENSTLGDVLTLGRALVVFDGIDEIIDISRRTAFVKAIEQFAIRYPLAPILVTARRVGYQKAPLRASEFTLYELDDFNDAQVAEYVQKWFAATERSEAERDSFLRESQNIHDVCANPLMLSLLCALYRARGYIPRNRREVYKSCADLLFQRWDSMRQIEQPMDHRQYGTRLMQDLAYFFYRSQSAQGGVEEGQLRKVITNFFTDTGSVEQEEGSRRAQAFLDFCADRAWLLTSQGTTDRGERLFGFTHRTFMEYFSAEEIVRRAASMDLLVEEVVKAYERDSSSVLADVIIQCADDKHDRGAEAIVAGLLEKTRSLGKATASKYVSLSLRILNAAPLPKRTTDAIFGALFDFWERTPIDDTVASSAELFDLYRDPRNRLYGLLLDGIEAGSSEPARAVLARWARFAVSSESGYFDEGWALQMADLASRLYAEEPPRDTAVQAFLLLIGIADVETTNLRHLPGWLTHLVVFGQCRLGPLSVELLQKVWLRENADFSVLDWAMRQDLSKWRIDNPYGLAESFEDISKFLKEMSPGQLSGIDPDGALRRLLLWLACALYESSSPSLHAFHEVVQGVHGLEWFARAAATRDEARMAGVDLRSRSRPFTRAELSRTVEELQLPTWFGKWCRGTAILTRAVD
ncbi:NACHT domain-containing protein [Streptomyces sp. KS 21]|uniref:NACHT domain-containing protein n=1 Tax=Streptomyces sp. KS 21 TaxID=2485150 RepID=UPI001062DA38|nr:NACHT domain-containing protein [Streptomyces sp. KS 21]TDU78125.1 NACHT domain-containing protein [Streptomyces sp. KS 21]